MQLAASRTLLSDRRCQGMLDSSDAHFVIEDEPIDLLKIFTDAELVVTEKVQPENGAAILDKIANAVVRDLMEWGIRIEDVPAIRRRIDEGRGLFEHESFSQLHRPIGKVPMNRFDIVLDDPPEARDKKTTDHGHKAWMENGSRACREVIKFVQEEFSEFSRPAHRDGKKGLQEEFRKMYRNLRMIEKKLRP